jgi:hypothetical protein
MNSRLFKHAFVLVVIVGFLDYIATKFYFFWTIWWFDMFMHFTCGALVALFAVLFLDYYFKITEAKVSKIILLTLLCVLFVGIMWEIYELLLGEAYLSDGLTYAQDTLSDLSFDLGGGLLGVFYSLMINKK